MFNWSGTNMSKTVKGSIVSHFCPITRIFLQWTRKASKSSQCFPSYKTGFIHLAVGSKFSQINMIEVGKSIRRIEATGVKILNQRICPEIWSFGVANGGICT